VEVAEPAQPAEAQPTATLPTAVQPAPDAATAPAQPTAAPAGAEPAATGPAPPTQPTEKETKAAATKRVKRSKKLISESLAKSWANADRQGIYEFQQAMKKFDTANKRRPSSHAEFMQEIVQKNNIRLPSVPAGQEVVYDPEKGILESRSTRPGGSPPAPPTISRTPPAPPAPPVANNAEKAKVGVGKKGRGYGGDPVTEPIRQRFLVEDNLNLMKMEKAIRDFKTLHERFPKSQAEFMSEIIEAHAVKLPELPAGDEYVYDPKKGELLVRHGAAQK
jgi:hypothetical protein